MRADAVSVTWRTGASLVCTARCPQVCARMPIRACTAPRAQRRTWRVSGVATTRTRQPDRADLRLTCRLSAGHTGQRQSGRERPSGSGRITAAFDAGGRSRPEYQHHSMSRGSPGGTTRRPSRRSFTRHAARKSSMPQSLRKMRRVQCCANSGARAGHARTDRRGPRRCAGLVCRLGPCALRMGVDHG
jgi:hypothetical protein